MQELDSLMREHIEHLKHQAFVAPTKQQVHEEEKRLGRIREVSADHLAEMRRTLKEGENMSEKPKVTLPGRVEKVINPIGDEPEKVQISLEDADPLYKEIRIENSLKDGDGRNIRLRPEDEVDVTVEGDAPRDNN